MANPSPMPQVHPSMPNPVVPTKGLQRLGGPTAGHQQLASSRTPAGKAPPRGFQYAGHSPAFKLPAGAKGKLVKVPAPKVSGSASNPLLNPNSTLSGSALSSAAGALADAQVKAPITQLSQQIAQNQKQTGAAQKTTAGYFQNLGQYVNQGNQQLGGISAGLNQTLENIGNQSRWNTASAFGPSQPLQNLGQQGLAQGAADALQRDQANQLGFAAQDAQTYRGAGLMQGANQQGLGASMLGTFGTRGMETIGKIGQAGQLENVPLNQKIGDLKASRGALYTTALGKLRQQEISNEITKAGLNLNQQKINATIANNNANQQLKAAGINAANTRSANSISAANTRAALALASRNVRNPGKSKGLTQSQQNVLSSQLGRIQSLITVAAAHGHKGNQVHQSLVSGTFQKGVPAFPSQLVEAAYELKGWGHILPSTAAALKAMGMNTRGLKVGPAPAGGILSGNPLANITFYVMFNGGRGPLPVPKAGLFSGLGKAVGNVGRSVGRATHNVQPHTAPQAGSDVQSTHGYDTGRATAFKQTPAYKQAVVGVFKAQPVAQKQAILNGALKTPTHEGQIVLNFVKQTLKSNPFDSSLKGLTHGQNVLGHLFSAGTGNYDAVNGKGKGGTSLPGGTVGNTYELFGGVKGQAHLLGNAGKDLINLPAETLATVGTVGGDALGGHLGKAIGDVVNPFVQTAKDPVGMFYSHPVNTTLMASGALAGASRLAAAPVRAVADSASAVGKAVGTAREGVALTGNLTHERPPFSRSPSIKAQQVAVDKALYTRAPDGKLIPRSEQLRRHQMNQEIGQLVGTQNRIRVVNRDLVHQQRAKPLTPAAIRRVGHAAKTALSYGPERALIPGADVLARIADATIRRPDTIVADLQKHLAQVSANRPHLLDDPRALKLHDAYVKTLTKAMQNKAFLKNPGPAFKAAEAYAKEYPVSEGMAALLGHFGDMTSEALQRRALMHYAVTHMDAKFDPEMGLVVEHPAPTAPRAPGDTSPVAARATMVKEPLSNAAILEHLKGKDGTGGRVPTYTPDRVVLDQAAASRGANYVPNVRRPLPTSKANTLYAYTHGLTNPGHGALTDQHSLMQGIVDAHRAQNRYMETLHIQMPGGGYARTYAEAKAAAPAGYKPINIAQPFHPQQSLSQAIEGVSPALVEQEALRHSLDLSARVAPGGEGRWGLIDNHALRVLNEHQNQISPNTLMRTMRGLNTQFRTVALATSAKHIPGVIQENLLRDIAAGVGFRSWVSGRRIAKAMNKTDPVRGQEIRTQLTGGQVAGMTTAGKTYTVADHWAGTTAYPVLKAMEATFKAPGARQLRTAWKAWTKFAIQGTKHVLEEQHQIAGLGKSALREHGFAQAAQTDGMMGLIHRAFGLHGSMLDDAAKGMFDPKKAQQTRAVIQQIYGKWTDLSPSAQTALMFSPFGLWWANSARFLARMPIDMPVKTGVLASATTGTQQERSAMGLDMFAPNALPGYAQGGIPIGGGKILGANYYSPFGVANDPLATGQSLIQPWLTPAILASLPDHAVNWLGKPLSSPNNPRGAKPVKVDQRIQYVLDSAMSSFIPLYTKAKTVMEGGAAAYDVNGNGLNPIPPATKTPGQGVSAGLEKAFKPFRESSPSSGKASKGRKGKAKSSAGGSYLMDGGGSGGGSTGGNLFGGSSSGGSSGGYLMP